MGFFGDLGGFFGKVGKAVGKGVWWGVRRPEAKLVSYLFAPQIMSIVLPVVEALEAEDETGQVKMAKAMNTLIPLLVGRHLKDKAQVRAAIEAAIQVARGEAKVE